MTQVGPIIAAVSQAPSSNDTLDDHVKRLKQTLTTATKLVKSAMEKTKEKNKDLHDLSQKQVVFDVGEMVRYWHLPKSAKGNAAKLKLRNGVYEVIKRDNNRYDIRHVNYPEIELKNVDVSYLARWRGEAPQIKDLFASTAQPVRKNMTDAFNAGSQAAAAAPVHSQVKVHVARGQSKTNSLYRSR